MRGRAGSISRAVLSLNVSGRCTFFVAEIGRGYVGSHSLTA